MLKTKLGLFKFSKILKSKIMKKAIYWLKNTIDYSINELDIFNEMLVERFYRESLSYIRILNEKMMSNEIYEDINTIISNFSIILNALDLELPNTEIRKLIEKAGEVKNEKILIESLLKYFCRKITVKIETKNFIDITLTALIVFYNEVLLYIEGLFEIHQNKEYGVIYLREFEIILKQIFKQDNVWNVIEFFK